jgi:hypothetical protein
MRERRGLGGRCDRGGGSSQSPWLAGRAHRNQTPPSGPIRLKSSPVKLIFFSFALTVICGEGSRCGQRRWSEATTSVAGSSGGGGAAAHLAWSAVASVDNG